MILWVFGTVQQPTSSSEIIVLPPLTPSLIVDAALQDITQVTRVLPPAQTILFRLAGVQTLAHDPNKALATLRRLECTSEVQAARDLATLIIQAEDSLGEGACYNPEFAVVAIAVAEMKIRVPLPREWVLIRVRGKFETDDLKGAEEALVGIPAETCDAEILLWKGKARLFRDYYLEAADLFKVRLLQGGLLIRGRKLLRLIRLRKMRSRILNWRLRSRPRQRRTSMPLDLVTRTKQSAF